MTGLCVRVGGASVAVHRNLGDDASESETLLYAREYIDLVSEQRSVRVRPGMFVYAANENTKDMTHAELLEHLDLLDVFYVREFVHHDETCAKLGNDGEEKSDDVHALVCVCRVVKDIKRHVAPHRVDLNDHDLVLCHMAHYASAGSFVAVMPAVIGPGRETPGTGGVRRVSAHSQDTDCESIVPYDVARGAAVDKVRLVALHANATPLLPNSDVAHFWDASMRKASVDAIASASLKPKTPPPNRTVVQTDSRSSDESSDSAPKKIIPKKRSSDAKTKTTTPSKKRSFDDRNGDDGDDDDDDDGKHGALEIDLSNSSWHQHKANLTGYIIALLQTESPEEVAFRLSAEAREEARVVCRTYHKSFGEFVDSVVLAERNTQAAAAFVSRFDGTLAHVAHGVFLRPLVYARLCQLVVAADVCVTPLPNRIVALAAQLRQQANPKK